MIFFSLFIRQFRIGLDKMLDVILRERMLIAHCLRINGRLGNTLFNEEVLDAANTAFGERLVVLRTTTWIRVTGQGQTRIRLERCR